MSVWVGLTIGQEHRSQKRSTYRILSYTILASMLAPCAASSAGAQEVVHAITGTLTTASTNDDIFSLLTEDGSVALFKASPVKNTLMTFSEDVEDQTVAANSFPPLGAHILVFYYGADAVRTAVATRDLARTNCCE